jgi:hypothetical protein
VKTWASDFPTVIGGHKDRQFLLTLLTCKDLSGSDFSAVIGGHKDGQLFLTLQQHRLQLIIASSHLNIYTAMTFRSTGAYQKSHLKLMRIQVFSPSK